MVSTASRMMWSCGLICPTITLFILESSRPVILRFIMITALLNGTARTGTSTVPSGLTSPSPRPPFVWASLYITRSATPTTDFESTSHLALTTFTGITEHYHSSTAGSLECYQSSTWPTLSYRKITSWLDVPLTTLMRLSWD